MKEKTEPFGLMGVFSHNDHINVDFLQEADHVLWNVGWYEMSNYVDDLSGTKRYQVLIREVKDE